MDRQFGCAAHMGLLIGSFCEIMLLTTITTRLEKTDQRGDRMNSEQEKARLLHLHETALRAHLEHDANTFLAAYASEWYDVRNAGVRLRTKEAALPAIERYFKRTHFSDISEMGAPIIHLATDASMAWVIGTIHVRATQDGADGKEQDFSFRCAFVSIYEKHGGEWAQVVDASSFRFQKDDDASSRGTS